MSDHNPITEVKQIVDDLRVKAEKFGHDSTEFKEFSAKVEKRLEADEKKNQDLVNQIAAERKAREDLNETIGNLEKELARKSAVSGAQDYKQSEEYKALNLLVKGGRDAVSAEQKAILRTDNDTQGGYLVPTEMDNIILKKITEISPVRSVARVRTTSKKTLEIPSRKTIPTANYEGETAESDESNSTYGSETLTAYRLTVTVPFTVDMLMDSAFDIESEIAQDVAEAFAQREGNRFVLGTGAKQPEGFLTNAALVAAAVDTAGSGVIAADDLLRMTGRLKVGYDPIFGFNRSTLATLRTLKGTTNDHYLWQVGIGPNVPNTLAGDPYVVMQDMPNIAAGNLSVVYGDFLRGYTIIDRTGMSMVRDEYTRKKNAIVELTFNRWNHGQVVQDEAFTLLKIKA